MCFIETDDIPSHARQQVLLGRYVLILENTEVLVFLTQLPVEFKQSESHIKIQVAADRVSVRCKAVATCFNEPLEI